MKKTLACAIALMLAAASARTGAQTSSSTAIDAVERPFASGGVVRFDLTAGEYRVEGTSAEKIRVQWRTRRPEDASRVRVDIETTGKEARVHTHGPRNGLEVRIEIPERSDIDLSLSAGDLTVSRITGNKRVDVWAGDVSIEVGERDAYRRVDAAVKFGDLDARPFDVNKGGIFRSFKWEGRGGYDLRARLFAGDLKLLR